MSFAADVITLPIFRPAQRLGDRPRAEQTAAFLRSTFYAGFATDRHRTVDDTPSRQQCWRHPAARSMPSPPDVQPGAVNPRGRRGQARVRAFVGRRGDRLRPLRGIATIIRRATSRSRSATSAPAAGRRHGARGDGAAIPACSAPGGAADLRAGAARISALCGGSSRAARSGRLTSGDHGKVDQWQRADPPAAPIGRGWCPAWSPAPTARRSGRCEDDRRRPPAQTRASPRRIRLR